MHRASTVHDMSPIRENQEGEDFSCKGITTNQGFTAVDHFCIQRERDSC